MVYFILSMSKKKRSKKFNISNRLAYTLIIVLSIVLLGIGVYAYNLPPPTNVGHTLNEIAQPSGCLANQVLTWTGSAWTCTTPASIPDTGIDWIKTSGGGGSGSIPTTGRWTYIDMGDTNPKHIRFDAYIDASGTGTSGTGVYRMIVSTNSVASSSGGTMIMTRNFQTPSISATQYQMSGDVWRTSDRYIILSLGCLSGTCNTDYYGLQVTKFSQ